MHFSKLHGLGNDFVIVDRRAQGAPVPVADAIRICDRHFGVGADGVLSIVPSKQAPFAMHVTNPDGSVAEMCGNGLRCVVRWATARGDLPPSGGVIETGRGLLACTVEPDGWIRVDMGRPILAATEIPTRLDGPEVIDRELRVAGRTLHVTAVSMGNPHAVVFVDDDRPVRAWALDTGPVLETDARFPNGVNAGFARVSGPAELELAVWERGAGLTLACGTGACAAVVAGVLTKRLAPAAPVTVHLPGGDLRVLVEEDLSRVWMSGPAADVFSGDTGDDVAAAR